MGAQPFYLPISLIRPTIGPLRSSLLHAQIGTNRRSLSTTMGRSFAGDQRARSSSSGSCYRQMVHIPFRNDGRRSWFGWDADYSFEWSVVERMMNMRGRERIGDFFSGWRREGVV